MQGGLLVVCLQTACIYFAWTVRNSSANDFAFAVTTTRAQAPPDSYLRLPGTRLCERLVLTIEISATLYSDRAPRWIVAASLASQGLRVVAAAP